MYSCKDGTCRHTYVFFSCFSDSLEILNSRRRRRTLQSTIHKVDTRSVDFRNDVLADVQKGTPNNMRAPFDEEVEDGQEK